MCYVFQNAQVPKGRVTVTGTLGRNYTVHQKTYMCGTYSTHKQGPHLCRTMECYGVLWSLSAMQCHESLIRHAPSLGMPAVRNIGWQMLLRV